MILYAVLAIVTVLLALFVNNRCARLQYGFSRQQVLNAFSLLSVFLLLFAVSALRLNVGNDYAKYVEYFHLIRCKLDTPTVVPTEFGFNAVCILIYLISGRNENFLLMFALFAFLTIFLFLKAIYRQADSFVFSFFLFMFLGYYFQSFNTIRYYFALAIAVNMIPYVLNREWFKFIALGLLGATFHKSLLVVIPLYFLASLTYKTWQLVVLLVLSSSTFFLKDYFLKLFLLIYPTYEKTEYLEGGTSMINILRCALILVFSLIMYNRVVKKHKRNSFYFYCNLGALVLYVCCSFLPAIGRVGYYLNITHIFFIPALINGIENKKIKKLVTIAVIAGVVMYFVIFLLKKAGADGLRILPYQTFLYHEMVPILSDVS
ncbi:MAG: EpsG family protein [Lachnospiraceae bacterium]|nr:EpsG family protein [Lachnospiraceae bacterium]